MLESPTLSFLSLSEVREIHDDQLLAYGGSTGVRDQGAFESAVAMPQATFDGAYLHGSIPAMAAAYLFHLCQNHAFVDGNKRVAAESALLFLALNRWTIELEKERFYEVVMAVACGTMGKAELINVFEAQSRAEGAIGSVY